MSTAQGTQLMRSAAEGDSALLLGGDLIVTVHQAEQLCGQERLTHPFARVCASEDTQPECCTMHPPAQGSGLSVSSQEYDGHALAGRAPRADLYSDGDTFSERCCLDAEVCEQLLCS